MDIVLNQEIEIVNKELKTITSEIRKAGANVIGNTFKISALIAQVNDDETLLEEDGFEDVFDYAKQCFNLEKAQVYNLIKVGTDFIEKVDTKNYGTLLTHGDNDYSISQVVKMLPLGIEKAQELTADGVINETMSCRVIDKIVKENTEGTKARGKKKDPEPEETDNDDVATDEIDEDETTLLVNWDDTPELFQAYILDTFDLEGVTRIEIAIPQSNE